ncbi:MAG TPA: alpha/beta fold hydrolase, partial [Fimbriimonadaceae bacterium]|nr:alpha/beta fold hydrolase [Fimbriimonadaceae bacterium]
MHGRRHGEPPYRRVVVHGGPGAPGSALGIANLLPRALEPYQSAVTVEGQIDELAQAISDDAQPPVVLIGHSWGAMLALLTAARHPILVAKVILVCSGGFSAEAYAQTDGNRMSRLSPKDRERAEEIKRLRRESPEDRLAELTHDYYEVISK